MFSLAYVSDERVPFERRALSALGERSASRNHERAITGYLYWREARFFQFLEGEERAVRELMERIRADARHEVGPVLQFGDWESRQFADWDMCFLDPGDALQARIGVVVDETMQALVAAAAAQASGRTDHRTSGQGSERGRAVMLIERLAALVREHDRDDAEAGR